MIHINPGYDSKGFSKVEIRDIAISVAVLALALTIIYSRVNASLFHQNLTVNILCWFLVSLLIVSTSFLFHEFGHKFVAQRFGAWAEYRKFTQGLIISVIMSFMGVLVAIPGAVLINGYIDDRRNGIISIAGPLVNIALGSVFLVLTLVSNGLPSLLFHLLAHFNLFLAAFNMLPIKPLDGSKIFAWNKPVYFATAGVAVALLVTFFFLF